MDEGWPLLVTDLAASYKCGKYEATSKSNASNARRGRPPLTTPCHSATIERIKTQPFQQTLRQLLNQEPFQPFVVELVDGRKLVVESSNVLFGGGAASF